METGKRLAGADELEAAIEKKLKEDPNFRVGIVADQLKIYILQKQIINLKIDDEFYKHNDYYSHIQRPDGSWSSTRFDAEWVESNPELFKLKYE